MKLNEQEMQMRWKWIYKWYELELNRKWNNMNMMQWKWIGHMIWNRIENEDDMNVNDLNVNIEIEMN